MILVPVLLVSLVLPGAFLKSIDKELDLKLVHVIFRHGARTPADTYPTDPHVNFDFKPYGWGQLTNKGKLQMYNNGKYLKERYSDFIGKEFKLEEIHAQSTDVSRTKMSLQLVLAGLFTPNTTPLEWNKELDWHPIPYSYEPLDQDTLLLVRTKCPRYYEALENVFANEAAEEIKKSAPLFEQLTNITGLPIQTPEDVQSLFATLQAEEGYGVELPEWTKEFYPDKLRPMTDLSFIYNVYTDEMKRIKGGPFLKKCINDWDKKSDSKLKQKFFIYGGHDATITNILSAFKVWEPQLPDYGITTMLEFSQHKGTGQHGVEIYLRNSTTVDAYPLTIPGCGQFCPLDELKKLLANIIPADVKAACKPAQEGFTEPPAGGP